MMYTEKNANSKWCPMARVISIEGNVCDTKGTGGGKIETNCIASECMCWRWRIMIPSDADKFGKEGYCGLTK